MIELSIGILGEYISRIFLESKKRPIFIVKDSNVSDTADSTDTAEEEETVPDDDKKKSQEGSEKSVGDKTEEAENEKVEYDFSYFE